MADARRMGKMELFAHFADKFDMKRTQVRHLIRIQSRTEQSPDKSALEARRKLAQQQQHQPLVV